MKYPKKKVIINRINGYLDRAIKEDWKKTGVKIDLVYILKNILKV